MLSYLTLIKRILNEKFNEKFNNNLGKKIMEFLINKKIYLIFLHVVENTFFAEIKAEAVRIIFSLLLRKTITTEQE
jgi:hypothetical protein